MLSRALWAAWWLRLGLFCCLVVLAVAGRAWAAGGGSSLPAATADRSVVVGEHVVVVLEARSDTASAAERARQANRILGELSRQDSPLHTTVLREADAAVIQVDGQPVLRLQQEDVVGDATLDGLAQQVVTALEHALQAEQRRARIANDVLSGSLVVLFGLVAFFAIRHVSAWARRARNWAEQHGEPLSLKVRDVEIVGPEMVESAALIALWLLRWLGLAAIVYTWLVVSLSLFRGTRAYTEKLTGIFIAPLSQLTARIAALVPVLVLVGIAVLAVFVLVRFVGLFFASVAKREASLSWVAPDLAIAVSIVLRAAIIVAALLFVGPLVTGSADGPFSQLGIVFMGAFALSSTPILASALVGMLVVFRRQLRVGDHVIIGTTSGRVSKLTLLEIRVENPRGVEARIPVLALLRTVVIHLGREVLAQAEVRLAASSEQQLCERALVEGATELGNSAACTLVGMNSAERRYRVSVRCANENQARLLVSKLADALQRADLQLVAAEAIERSPS